MFICSVLLYGTSLTDIPWLGLNNGEWNEFSEADSSIK